MVPSCIPCLAGKHEACSNGVSVTKGCQCCPLLKSDTGLPNGKRVIKRRPRG